MWNQLPFDLFIGVSAHLVIADLAACRRVCARWRAMADDDLVWSRRQPRPRRLPECWKAYCVLYTKMQNLVANPDGSSGARSWTCKNAYYSRWDVVPIERQIITPAHSFLNRNIDTCFIAASGRCVLFQTVDLCRAGYARALLDYVRPDIMFCFWYAVEARIVRCRYTYCIELISEDMVVLDRICCVIKTWTNAWQCAKHAFRDYPRGARYVHFSHSSTSDIGAYGVGVTGHVLILKYPQKYSGGKSTADHYDPSPRALYRCTVCNAANCTSAACARFKCGLSGCPRAPVRAGCVHAVCLSPDLCSCADCGTSQCDCANCASMKKFYIKCDCYCNCEKCTDCYGYGVKCGCARCRCADCSLPSCPCETCSCDRSKAITHYDVKSHYIELECRTCSS
ncbi:putative F-box-containing protein [Namao virus]|nr:putative F-box-containing protein [Namao virus]